MTGARDPRLRVFQAVTVVLIAGALAGAFYLGVLKAQHRTIADHSWGRVQFAIGAAITSMYHGGYGYTISNVVRELLTAGGLTADPASLSAIGTRFPDNLRTPPLIENAMRNAINFQWPFDPAQQVTGSSGEDLGLVDYVRLSFLLFGNRVVGFYLTYFVVILASFALAVLAFRRMPGILAMWVVYAVGIAFLFASNLFDDHVIGVFDPRFLSTLALVPAAHVAFAMVAPVRWSVDQIVLVLGQAIILVFAYWIRSSAFWTVLGLSLLALAIATHALWRRDRDELVRLWPFGVLLVVIAAKIVYATQVLHPVYRQGDERPHHAFWHAVIYALPAHPGWIDKYAARYGWEDVDAIPDNMAKDYLLRHPPTDPSSVYLTPDRKYLRIGAAEAYHFRAFLEFFANDPRFVAEAFLIYNARLCLDALSRYIGSIGKVSLPLWFAFALVVLVGAILVAAAGLLFAVATLIVSLGFLVSMVPMVFTAPGTAVMADQFFMLVVTALGCGMLVLSAVVVFVRPVFSAIRRPHAGLGTGERP